MEENVVYSVNTQYAGNTVGLKKLSLRLAINKASREGWLAEHMLVMASGKTSTAMLPGESIIGDDIAYLRKRGTKVMPLMVSAGYLGNA